MEARRAQAGDAHFYAPYAAQGLVAKHEDEIGIKVVPFEEHAYSNERKRYLPMSQVSKDDVQSYSTADFNKALSMGDPVPEWYTYKEVVEVLKQAHPPRSQQGATLLFTGLSGAGKSTIAKIVYGKLIEHGNRPVTLLDGDVVRLNLSSELGFSKTHRDLNVRRIGFVASEITKNRGFAICAPIAPYSATRSAVRDMVSAHGAFIEVHVSTPLEVCESRDRKGLYAKARQGIIPEFTGVSDPYEVPQTPELRIDTTSLSPMEAAERFTSTSFARAIWIPVMSRPRDNFKSPTENRTSARVYAHRGYDRRGHFRHPRIHCGATRDGAAYEARLVKVETDLRAISSALELYRLDNFQYPSTEQGLDALISKAPACGRACSKALEIGRLSGPLTNRPLGQSVSIYKSWAARYLRPLLFWC